MVHLLVKLMKLTQCKPEKNVRMYAIILYLSIIFIDLDASIQYDVKFEDKGVQNTTQGTCTLCYNLYLHIHVGIDQFDYLTLSFGMNIMFKLF